MHNITHVLKIIDFYLDDKRHEFNDPISEITHIEQMLELIKSKLIAVNIIQDELIHAIRHVSFYAHINHGTKSSDYGEIVNPVLVQLGFVTGEYPQPQLKSDGI